mmetsp:Transcript_2912/g.10639  ORF Transcript_2912/g.10639 Transcript_2912/m.10639 type:complete len:489 (-) Transcript_2912:1292-2758(-)
MDRVNGGELHHRAVLVAKANRIRLVRLQNSIHDGGVALRQRRHDVIEAIDGDFAEVLAQHDVLLHRREFVEHRGDVSEQLRDVRFAVDECDRLARKRAQVPAHQLDGVRVVRAAGRFENGCKGAISVAERMERTPQLFVLALHRERLHRRRCHLELGTHTCAEPRVRRPKLRSCVVQLRQPLQTQGCAEELRVGGEIERERVVAEIGAQLVHLAEHFLLVRQLVRSVIAVLSEHNRLAHAVASALEVDEALLRERIRVRGDGEHRSDVANGVVLNVLHNLDALALRAQVPVLGDAQRLAAAGTELIHDAAERVELARGGRKIFGVDRAPARLRGALHLAAEQRNGLLRQRELTILANLARIHKLGVVHHQLLEQCIPLVLTILEADDVVLVELDQVEENFGDGELLAGVDAARLLRLQIALDRLERGQERPFVKARLRLGYPQKSVLIHAVEVFVEAGDGPGQELIRSQAQVSRPRKHGALQHHRHLE